MRAKIKGFRSVPGGCFRMKRKELTYRLSELGMSKAQFAALLGMAEVTVYQWEEPPQYATALLGAMEELAACREKLREALGSVALLKVTIAGLEGQRARKG